MENFFQDNTNALASYNVSVLWFGFDQKVAEVWVCDFRLIYFKTVILGKFCKKKEIVLRV
jgi:hypothetical protein